MKFKFFAKNDSNVFESSATTAFVFFLQMFFVNVTAVIRNILQYGVGRFRLCVFGGEKFQNSGSYFKNLRAVNKSLWGGEFWLDGYFRRIG